MEKNALHHTPTRKYSHAWGETHRELNPIRSNRLTGNSEISDSENFPLESLPAANPAERVSRRRRFTSLTKLRKNDGLSSEKKSDSLNDPKKLESRLSRLKNQLSDYRWAAETDIIDRTSDAVVHLDQMANEYRASVRAELEKFRDETGEQSLLQRSLVESALRRLSRSDSKKEDQFHHSMPSSEHHSPDSEEASPAHQKGPIFFNYLPRSETEK